MILGFAAANKGSLRATSVDGYFVEPIGTRLLYLEAGSLSSQAEQLPRPRHVRACITRSSADSRCIEPCTGRGTYVQPKVTLPPAVSVEKSLCCLRWYGSPQQPYWVTRSLASTLQASKRFASMCSNGNPLLSRVVTHAGRRLQEAKRNNVNCPRQSSTLQLHMHPIWQASSCLQPGSLAHRARGMT